MAQNLCEDVLDRVLTYLLKMDMQNVWSGNDVPRTSILPFMLVGRAWLEVGRRRLYSSPNLTKSLDCMPLFQTSLSHHNPGLGTHVRSFDTIGIDFGPLVLSRMVALMANLTVLLVDSLDFAEHYPKGSPLPCLSVLEVSSSADKPKRCVVPRKMDRELLLDNVQLLWLCSAYEVRLRCFLICAQTAIAPPLASNLHTLLLDQCIWDHSAHAEVIPHISCRIKELRVNNFGRTHDEEPGRRRGRTAWEDQVEGPANAYPLAVEQQLPGLYGLARQVQHFELEYAPGMAFSAGPDLKLLSNAMSLCEIDYQDAVFAASRSEPHSYPPNARSIRIRLNKLDLNLLRFVRELQRPDYLIGLETYPEIWLKAPNLLAVWENEASGITLPVANPEEWKIARQSAMSSLAQRGLQLSESPTRSMVKDSLNSYQCFGEVERKSWYTMEIEYLNFWSWPFSLRVEAENGNGGGGGAW